MNVEKALEYVEMDYNWWEASFECYVEDLAAKGIEISSTTRKGRKHPDLAISFSGFYSQGDGLAFDCIIDWPKFFEAYPKAKEDMLEWFLVLSANPGYARCGTKRTGRNKNIMQSWSDFEYDDVVEAGFYAGMEWESLPELSGVALDEYVLGVCQDEATTMYKGLEEEYEYLMEEEKERRAEDLLEEHKDVLAEAIAILLLEGTSFNTMEVYLPEGVEMEDLDALGLVEQDGKRGSIWSVTPKGIALLGQTEINEENENGNNDRNKESRTKAVEARP